MSADAVLAVKPEWSQEVAELAAQEQAAHQLPAVLALTRRLFPDARRLEVRLEQDWEIAGQSYIVFEVEVAGWDVSQARAARHQWMRELRQHCPSPRPGPFVLGLELVES